MKDQPVYYCWFCDAHRVASVASGSACCPRCGRALPDAARLARHTIPFAAESRSVVDAEPPRRQAA